MEQERPSRLAWLTLMLLILAAMLSFVDRQILALLVTPIKADLGVSDVQISLLQGLAFAVFYAVAAIPCGWLVDRSSRKWVLVVGVAVWSLMTATSGFARSFLGLFLARVGVGAGEATLGPAAQSMLADLFGARLPLAMSLYGGGVSLGAGLAFLLGGQVVQWAASAPALQLPWVGALAAWKLTFFIVGLPGLLLALVFTMLPEPARRHAVADAQMQAGLWSFVRNRAAAAWLTLGGLAAVTASGFASLAWLAAFFERRFGWGPDVAGGVIGLLLIGAGVSGGVLCGGIASRLNRGDLQDGARRTIVWASLLGAPVALAAYLAPSAGMAVVSLAVAILLGGSYIGLGPAMLQAATPSGLRGRVAAWQLLLTGLIGMIAGPLSVAALTDLVFRDEARIGWSLAVSVAGFNLLGAALLAAARKPYRAALAAAAAEEAR